MKKTLALLCFAALPLFAQEHRTVTTRTTTTTETRSTRGVRNRTRVYNDASRLAALLHDMQSRATINRDTWGRIANEANALSNRLTTEASGNQAAREARVHVRQMQRAARNGDVAGAQTHAHEALPYVYQVIEWSSPDRR